MYEHKHFYLVKKRERIERARERERGGGWVKRESGEGKEVSEWKEFSPNVFLLIAHHHHHQRHHITSHVYTIASNQTNYKQNVEVLKVNALSSAVYTHTHTHRYTSNSCRTCLVVDSVVCFTFRFVLFFYSFFFCFFFFILRLVDVAFDATHTLSSNCSAILFPFVYAYVCVWMFLCLLSFSFSPVFVLYCWCSLIIIWWCIVFTRVVVAVIVCMKFCWQRCVCH